MRRKAASVAGSILFVSLASIAGAAVPAAPEVTVGADIKQLQFDWEAVPTSSRYELWFKANDGAAWTRYTEIPADHVPRIRINVSVHLLDWRVARYRVAACNSSGCTTSAEVPVTHLGNDAVGYFKPNASAYSHWYGAMIALSADGRTFAVESGENRGTATETVGVHVYRKASAGSGWRYEAEVLPTVATSNSIQPYSGGNPLALSGDGNVLALGVPLEDVGTPGSPASGAVYLFRRDGARWQLEQKLLGDPDLDHWFGTQVELDDAGTTLAITHNRIPPDSGFDRGGTRIYRKDGSGWQHVRSLPVPASPLNECFSISLSGDGQTLFRTCSDANYVNGIVQVFRAPTWDSAGVVTSAGANWVDSTYDGARFVVRSENNFARVFDWSGGSWTQDGAFQMGKENYHGPNVAISRDGAIVAGGDYFDTLAGTGIVYPGTQQNGTKHTGSIFVYERRSFGWNLRRILKPVVSMDYGDLAFGTVIALGDRGRILAVGAFNDASAASGIGGDPTNTSAPERGAAWLY
jgi:hypothetical protein